VEEVAVYVFEGYGFHRLGSFGYLFKGFADPFSNVTTPMGHVVQDVKRLNLLLVGVPN
jgi:hypothetical protein